MGVVGEEFFGCQESTGKTGDRHAEEVNLTLLPESEHLQIVNHNGLSTAGDPILGRLDTRHWTNLTWRVFDWLR